MAVEVVAMAVAMTMVETVFVLVAVDSGSGGSVEFGGGVDCGFAWLCAAWPC